MNVQHEKEQKKIKIFSMSPYLFKVFLKLRKNWVVERIFYPLTCFLECLRQRTNLRHVTDGCALHVRPFFCVVSNSFVILFDDSEDISHV